MAAFQRNTSPSWFNEVATWFLCAGKIWEDLSDLEIDTDFLILEEVL